MFRTDSMYSGSLANSMVSHMVGTYKKQITDLTKTNCKYKAESEAFERDRNKCCREHEITKSHNDLLVVKNKNLQSAIIEKDAFIYEYKVSIEELKNELKYVKKSKKAPYDRVLENESERLLEENKKLKKEIELLEKEKKNLQNINSSLESDNVELRNVILELRKKKTDDNPFVSSEFISSYGITERTEVEFHLNKMPDGTQYIDARKYYEGKPTRKGICLELEDFDTFLRYGRTAWSRVISGLFKYTKK